MLKLFKRSKPEVLVVGAGPVGLFAALQLVKLGVRPRIIDAEQGGATRSYALALHPRSLELLAGLGLASQVLEQARRIDRVGIYDGPERTGQIELSRLPGPFPFLAIMAQSHLEDLLAGELAEHGIAIEWNHRLADIVVHGDHVAATVDRLEKVSTGYAVMHMETVTTSSKSIDIPFVLGADGHDSLVRKKLGIGFDSVEPAQHFAVVEFQSESTALPDELRIVIDDESTNVLWPMPRGRYRWSFELEHEIAGETRRKDQFLASKGFPDVDPETIDELIRRRAPWFAGDLRDAHWRIVVRFEHRLASSFGDRRVWLAGDAGHLTGPVGVQSMNVGLREAATLCDLYARVLHGDAAVDALSGYGRERLDEWRFLLGLVPRLAPSRPASGLAARASRLVSCIPASGGHLDRALDQLGLAAARVPSGENAGPQAARPAS